MGSARTSADGDTHSQSLWTRPACTRTLDVVTPSERVAAVLSGSAAYDDLTNEEQDDVRALWEALNATAIASLDFSQHCPDCGASYAQSPACRPQA